MGPMKTIPSKYYPQNALLVDSAEKTLRDVHSLFSQLGVVEKTGNHSSTASFQHPDGPRVTIKVKLYRISESRVVVMDVLRIAGDALFASLIMTYLKKCLAGESMQAFHRGQIIPLLTHIRPHESPEEPPSLRLDEDIVFPDTGTDESNKRARRSK